MLWQFFHRSESNRVDPATLPCKVFEFKFDTIDPAEALLEAYDAGMPKGSARAGCVEIQSDEGIYSRDDGKRIDFSTPRRASKVRFYPWEEE